MVDPVPSVAPAAPPVGGAPQRPDAGGSQSAESFVSTLQRLELQRATRGAARPLTFSKHALQRIAQRGLLLDASRMERLESAVGRAESKGGRDSLVLLDELALVVSVRSRTVITAMDEASRKEHVFTNIDSVVIAP